MPNKQLTAKVRLNTSQAEKSIDNLVKKINKLNSVTNKAANAGNQSQKYAKTQRQVDSIVNKVRSWANAQKQVTSNTKTTNKALSAIGGKLKAIAATYFGIMGAKAVINTTDTLVGAQNRLNYVSAGQLGDAGYNSDGSYSASTLNMTQDALDKMYASSQKVRTSYQDMMGNVSKTMTLAGDAFHNSIDNAIRFQEIMAEAYAVGGASAAEMSSSMYQLTQALGSGVLQGDELRSLREGAPLAYQAIEKFAQGVLDTSDSLKDLAADGLITSEMVVAAVMDMGDGIDNAFNQTRQTFGQTFDQIKNTALYAFQPVMESLTNALDAAVNNGLVQKFEVLFNNIAKALLIVFAIIENIVTFVADNWDWLSKILLTAATIIGGVLLGALILNLMTIGGVIKGYILLGIEAVKAALMSAASWLTLCLPLTIIIALLAALVIAVIWVSDSFVDACGIIVGVIMVAVAFVWNIIVGVINAILQFMWTNFVEPWIGIIEWVLNVFNGGFNSFGDGVKNLLGNIISWFLSLGQVVTKIIDAIFGTNWTGGLESLKSNVLKWGKNETAITLSREAPSLSNIGVDRWAYGDAYSTGYDWGYAGGTWLNDKFSGIGLDGIGEKLGLDFSDMTTPFPDTGVGSGYTPDYEKLLGGIGDDTGKIADSMDLTQEDLEYLRRIADMEWKKEFTAAEIKIDMTNNNQVNGESDLDGIVTKLADKLYEEMNVLANGVYA